jgi:hypothetical protein
MKTRILTLLMVCATFQLAIGQNKSTLSFETFRTGEGKNIQIVGEESTAFTDSLFTHFDKKNKRYITRFKNVSIEGIKKPITFQVHQGYSGKIDKEADDKSKKGGGSYFHTFDKKNNRKCFLANKKSTEKEAISIYLKRGRNFGIKSDEEFELVKKYLLSIYS